MLVLNKFFYDPLICLGLLTCCPKILYAQSKFIDTPNEYLIKHYTDEEGLPQNSIKSIVKDSRGFIWLSTDMGLARFDGSEFKPFRNFESVHSDPNESTVTFLINPGGTSNNGFYIRRDRQTFIHVFDGTAQKDTMVYEKSLLSQPFSKSGIKVMLNNLPSLEPSTNPETFVVALGSDQYYVCRKEQIEYYSHKKLKKVIKFTNNGPWNFFRLDNFLFHFDEHMQLTRFNGLAENPDTKNITLQGDITKHPLYHASVKYQIFWNNCTNQAFILLGNSFYRLLLSPNQGLTTDLILEKFDFKLNKIISSFYDDVHEKLFLGAFNKGLYVIETKPFKPLLAKIKGTDEVYYGQTLLNTNSILTGQGNLFTLDSASKHISVSQLRPITQAADWDKYNITIDVNGNIWTTNGMTLFKFDHSGKKLLAKWNMHDRITRLYGRQPGRIWIGTEYQGLYYLDTSSPHGIPRPFSTRIPFKISWIQTGKAGELWIGTDKGLYKISLATGKLTSINGLKNIAIRSMNIPAEGNDLWITTYKDGFFLFRNNRLTQFPLDPKGYLATTHCMIEDKKGYFWIPTNKGLFQVLKSDLIAYANRPFDIYYHYYSKHYGFNSNEFNGGCEPCAVRFKDSYISLPSMDGLIWFTPENIHPETPSGKIYVDHIRVNGVMTSCPKDSLIIPQPLESISLTLASPFFGDMYNRQIDYTLFQKGKPMVWHPIDDKNLNILIPNLGSGKYALIIRKKNGFGTNNLEYKKIYIEVEKEWFETTKFWILAGLLFAFIVYICFGVRTRQIKKRNILLENQVYARTLDLQETLKTLNLSQHELKEQVKLHVRLIASISHDIQTPVYQIGEVAKNIEKLIQAKNWDDAGKSGKAIEHTSGKIYEMLHNMVNFIKPRVYGTIVDFLPVDVLALAHEKASIFEEILAMKGGKIDIRSACNEERVITNPNLLGIIIHNLLDNAIKIKKDGLIDIHVKKEKEKLHLIISDQGPGFPSTLLRWINNDDSQLPEDYGGLGLLMVKEISKFIKIDIYAENDAGARVYLIFNANTIH